MNMSPRRYSDSAAEYGVSTYIPLADRISHARRTYLMLWAITTCTLTAVLLHPSNSPRKEYPQAQSSGRTPLLILADQEAGPPKTVSLNGRPTPARPSSFKARGSGSLFHRPAANLSNRFEPLSRESSALSPARTQPEVVEKD